MIYIHQYNTVHTRFPLMNNSNKLTFKLNAETMVNIHQNELSKKKI